MGLYKFRTSGQFAEFDVIIFWLNHLIPVTLPIWQSLRPKIIIYVTKKVQLERNRTLSSGQTSRRQGESHTYDNLAPNRNCDNDIDPLVSDEEASFSF